MPQLLKVAKVLKTKLGDLHSFQFFLGKRASVSGNSQMIYTKPSRLKKQTARYHQFCHYVPFYYAFSTLPIFFS